MVQIQKEKNRAIEKQYKLINVNVKDFLFWCSKYPPNIFQLSLEMTLLIIKIINKEIAQIIKLIYKVKINIQKYFKRPADHIMLQRSAFYSQMINGTSKHILWGLNKSYGENLTFIKRIIKDCRLAAPSQFPAAEKVIFLSRLRLIHQAIGSLKRFSNGQNASSNNFRDESKILSPLNNSFSSSSLP